MKKLLFLGVAVISIAFMVFTHSTGSFSANNLLLGNIEALASNETEIPTKVKGCYLDTHIAYHKEKAARFTVCNTATTPSLAYKCEGDKPGLLTWDALEMICTTE